jgi:serine protease inhibitor ecotin
VNVFDLISTFLVIRRQFKESERGITRPVIWLDQQDSQQNPLPEKSLLLDNKKLPLVFHVPNKQVWSGEDDWDTFAVNGYTRSVSLGQLVSRSSLMSLGL